MGNLWRLISWEPRALTKADKHTHFKTHTRHTHTHTHAHSERATHASERFRDTRMPMSEPLCLFWQTGQKRTTSKVWRARFRKGDWRSLSKPGFKPSTASLVSVVSHTRPPTQLQVLKNVIHLTVIFNRGYLYHGLSSFSLVTPVDWSLKDSCLKSELWWSWWRQRLKTLALGWCSFFFFFSPATYSVY